MADRVPYRSPRSKPAPGFGKRLMWIFVVGIIVAAVISLGSSRSDRRPASPPPGPEPMARMSAKRLQAHATDNAVVAGADAAQRALSAARLAGEDDADDGPTVHVNATVKQGGRQGVVMTRRDSEEPRGKAKPALRIARVRSSAPHPNQGRALNDALDEARTLIAERLRSLDEPIRHVPTVEEVRNKYLRPESVTEIPLKPEDKAELEAKNLDPNRVWVEIDVELSDDQLRELRSADRVGNSGLYAGLAFVLALALFGFLRLDAWTKGYLTAGIGVAVAVAAGGAVALLFLAA